jgi:mannosyltransferase OCH1-like enzyme
MATWRVHHPGWEWRLWTEPEVDDFGLTNRSLWDGAEAITPEAPHQFRSDVARYEILHRFGGVWVDADFECRRPFDDLLTTRAFAGWEVDARWVNNALIGAVPDHPLLAEAVERLPANVARWRPNVGNTKKSGPQFFTPLARRHDIRILPSVELYPYLWNELDRVGESFPRARAIHHWNHRRSRV